MKCQTIKRYDILGNPILELKRKFETLELAISEAKRINSNIKIIHKVVAYKCTECFKYHIGRNGRLLKDKERIKWTRN